MLKNFDVQLVQLSQNQHNELSLLNATKTNKNFEYHEPSKDILQLVSTSMY